MIIDLLDLPGAGAFWGVFVVGESGDSPVSGIVCGAEDHRDELKKTDSLTMTDIANKEIDEEGVRDNDHSLLICVFEKCSCVHDAFLHHVAKFKRSVLSCTPALKDVPTKEIPERERAEVRPPEENGRTTNLSEVFA